MSCVTTISPPLYWLSAKASSSTLSVSRLLVGSSSSKRVRGKTEAIASANLARSPPLKVPATLFTWSSIVNRKLPKIFRISS